MGLKSLARYVLCGALAAWLPVTAVDAATYYVATPTGSPPGSDARSCPQALVISTPKATLGNAVTCLSAGDTLLVRAGSYPEMLHTNLTPIPSGTSWDNKVRIAAYPGETVWMRPVGTFFVIFLGSAYGPKYIEFDGINLDGGGVQYFVFKNEAGVGYNADHLRLLNAEIIGPTNPEPGGGSLIISYNGPGNETGGGFNEYRNLHVHDGGRLNLNQDHGFYVGTSDNIIELNLIERVPGFGVSIWNHFLAEGLITEGPRRNIIRRNIIKGGIVGAGGGGGLVCGTDHDTEVYSNVVSGISKAGFSVAMMPYASFGCHISNNTVYGSVQYGIYVDQSATNAVIKNNISYANAFGDYVNEGVGTSTATNLFGTNPQFVNAGAGDFHIQPGSPARNRGSVVSAVQVDFTGAASPAEGTYDIGAYEFRTGGSPPAAPTGLHVVPE